LNPAKYYMASPLASHTCAEITAMNFGLQVASLYILPTACSEKLVA